MGIDYGRLFSFLRLLDGLFYCHIGKTLAAYGPDLLFRDGGSDPGCYHVRRQDYRHPVVDPGEVPVRVSCQDCEHRISESVILAFDPV